MNNSHTLWGIHSPIWRYSALIAYLSLGVWILVWQMWLSPHPHIEAIKITLLWFLPWLLPLYGILRSRPYTHAWANFILMFYFLHALTVLYLNEGEQWLAAIELLIISISFISNIGFARTRGKS